MIDKRKALQRLSTIAAKLVEMGEADTINDGLITIYKNDGHKIFNSFKKWMEKGFVVKRGETALLLWGQPLKGKGKEKSQEPSKKDNPQDEYDFFPLAFIFSDKQVQPLNK